MTLHRRGTKDAKVAQRFLGSSAQPLRSLRLCGEATSGNKPSGCLSQRHGANDWCRAADGNATMSRNPLRTYVTGSLAQYTRVPWRSRSSRSGQLPQPREPHAASSPFAMNSSSAPSSFRQAVASGLRLATLSGNSLPSIVRPGARIRP